MDQQNNEKDIISQKNKKKTKTKQKLKKILFHFTKL